MDGPIGPMDIDGPARPGWKPKYIWQVTAHEVTNRESVDCVSMGFSGSMQTYVVASDLFEAVSLARTAIDGESYMLVHCCFQGPCL